MAAQLKEVIQRMSKANANLEKIAVDTDSVSDMATLWRESYQTRDDEKQEKDGL